MPTLYPTTDIVAVALLRTVPELDPTKVNTQLPKNSATWVNGFVQVMGVGGVPGQYVPLHEPIVEISVWTGTPSNGRPAWLKANQLIEHIKAFCLTLVPTKLTLSAFGDYYPAIVHAAFFLPGAGPRRMPNDDGSYAHYSGDMQIHWSPQAPIG